MPPEESSAPVEAASEAPASEAPVTEAPAGGEPVTEAGTPAPDAAPEDPYASYGGKDAVEAAIKLHKATQTDDGVVQLFFEAGRSLGLGVKEMEAIFGGEPDDDKEPEDLDRPLTVKEFRDQLAQQQAAQQTQTKKQVEAACSKSVVTTMQELGLEAGTETAALVLQMGDRYLDQKNLSPEAAAAAVKRGHADYQALIEKESRAYLAKKSAKAASVPGAPSGASAPSSPPPEEPKNISEAIRMARQRLYGS